MYYQKESQGSAAPSPNNDVNQAKPVPPTPPKQLSEQTLERIRKVVEKHKPASFFLTLQCWSREARALDPSPAQAEPPSPPSAATRLTQDDPALFAG